MTTDLLKQEREREEFKQIMKEAERLRPVIPAFSLCKTKDEQDMMIEAIKYHTSMRSGFDLLFQHLAGRSPNVFNLIKE
jgi:hypothetical protein